MSALATTLRRELRVACSRHGQPVWLRVVKWACILTGTAVFYDRPWFWWTLAGLAAAGTALHGFYRWKTKVWTRAWGGRDDLPAGGD